MKTGAEQYDAIEEESGVAARLLAELDDGKVNPASLAAYVRLWETPVDAVPADEDGDREPVPADKPVKAAGGRGGK